MKIFETGLKGRVDEAEKEIAKILKFRPNVRVFLAF